MKKLAALSVVLISLTAVGQAQAFDWFGGRLSIGGGYGRAKPKLPYSFQDSHQDGEMWTANAKYYLNNDVAIVASYADLEPYARGDKQDQFRFRPMIASLRYNFLHHLPVTPYITAGAGYSINKHEAPGVVATKWSGFAYQAGLGLEFFITEGTSLGVEALYHSFEANGDNVPYRLISGVGTVNFYFGPGPSQRRTEEALQREKAEAEKARADAEAAKAQALAAQQGQQSAQSQAAAAAAAQAAALQKAQQMQAQAQAEVNAIKDMVARKDLQPVNFKTGSAELLAESSPALDKVAEVAKKYPSLNLRVEGHTDSQGSTEYNQALSEKRAAAVRDYLVSKGVPADKVTSVGFGKTRPIASNDTPEGRAQNRRVEFIFQVPQ
jgi:outer membrane protein OmpA-like peptidoglycan-associated protein/opacity protein-like surface antigen